MTSLDISARESAIDDYDFSFVYEKMRMEGTLPTDSLNKVEEEFKKFLKLLLVEDGPLAMLDRRVDNLWHTFILFTPQYQSFCSSVMGFFVHHQPRTSRTPVPIAAIMNFVNAYKRRYGEFNSFWTDLLDTDLKANIAAGSVSETTSFNWSGWTGR